MSSSLCQSHIVFYDSSYILSFENRVIIPTLFFRILLAVILLPFHINIKIIMSTSTKTYFWDLGRNYVKSVSQNLERIDILCWVFPFIDIDYLSVVFFGFQHTNPVHILLNIQLSIYFTFLSNCKWYWILHFGL